MRATFNTMDFSELNKPTAPGSLPPCPTSITTVLTRKPSCSTKDGFSCKSGKYGTLIIEDSGSTTTSGDSNATFSLDSDVFSF